MTKIKRTTKADIHALIQQVHDAIYNYDGDTGCGPMVAQQLYGLIADLHDVLDGRDAGTTRYRDWIEAAKYSEAPTTLDEVNENFLKAFESDHGKPACTMQEYVHWFTSRMTVDRWAAIMGFVRYVPSEEDGEEVEA